MEIAPSVPHEPTLNWPRSFQNVDKMHEFKVGNGHFARAVSTSITR